MKQLTAILFLFISFSIKAQIKTVRVASTGGGGTTADTTNNTFLTWAQANLRYVQFTDTTSMLAAYQSAINGRVKYTDTASMLAAYQTALNVRVKYSDTSSMLSAYQTAINARVKYTDTSSMLSAYQTAINARVKYTDTSSMLSAYQTAINARVKYTDTSSMLSAYQTAINARVKYTDTLAMLSGYQTAINKNTDSITSHNTRIGAVTVSDALKWSINGTAATAGSSVLGTSNNVSLRLITNGTVRGLLDSATGGLVVGYNQFNQASLTSTQADGLNTAAFWSDGTNTNQVVIGGVNSTSGGAVLRGFKARGTLASPTAALAGDLGLSYASQFYLSDSAKFSGSLVGFHTKLLTQATKAGGGTTEWQFFTANGLSGRRWNLYLRPDGKADFYDSTSSSWNAIRSGIITVTGNTLVDQTRAISVTANMPTGTATLYNAAQDMQITSASNTQNQYAFNLDLLSTGTDAKIYAAGRFHSGVAGTGANLLGVVGNYGTLNFVDATTTGYNVAAYNWANGGGALAVGSVNMSRASNNSKRNIGAVVIGNNAGTGTAETGLYVGMNTSDPTFIDGALVVDNAAEAKSIQVWRDNGTVIATMADGGAVRIGDATSPTDKLEVTGNIALTTAGNKLKIATGTNASVGVSAAMIAGTITISTTAVTSSSKIFLTHATLGGTQGILSVGTIVNGTSFVINSSNAADTGTVNWIIIN